MEAMISLLVGSQLVFTIIAGVYFFNSLKTQLGSKNSVNLESKSEIERLRKLRDVKLSKPLSEKTRPECFTEIVGQEQGLRALSAALCGPNPQHVIIYGPPGVGKTAAARVILKEAIANNFSPFSENAPFIEMDATILQFDERSIADPLIGSVHDPIYQGAGSYGQAGIPQPKPGAVTKAHGGILFLDEIGELHQVQMNKLLKVLEDRKVFLTSSYYVKGDTNTPKHVHDIFSNGFPADFRLVGATTRKPEDIPPALRSRCTEIFFNPLNANQVIKIAQNASEKAGYTLGFDCVSLISRYSKNGRDTVNIIQTASSIAALSGNTDISLSDIEEVIEYGRYTPIRNVEVTSLQRVGVVNGLAVSNQGVGALMEIEVHTQKTDKAKGIINVTGIVDEEELNNRFGKVKRKSTAKSSVENVVTLLSKYLAESLENYDIHINFPGGVPVDGPSAGVAIFTAVYSAINENSIDSQIALTGEISIKGRVCPVGGVRAKLEAAIEAGVKKVYIPEENYQESFASLNIEIVKLNHVEQILEDVFSIENVNKNKQTFSDNVKKDNVLIASS